MCSSDLDIPTIAEAGVPGFESMGWTLMSVPSATPKSIVERLHAEMSAVAAMPEINNLIVKLGALPLVSPPPPELQKFLAAEIVHWGNVIERAGVAHTQ